MDKFNGLNAGSKVSYAGTNAKLREKLAGLTGDVSNRVASGSVAVVFTHPKTEEQTAILAHPSNLIPLG